METNGLADFMAKASEQTAVLNNFVEAQRMVSQAVRNRDWPGLELAIKRAGAWATMVAGAERARENSWQTLLAGLALPTDSSVFRVSLALPVEQRSMLTDTHRNLKLATMRARIENEALADFVGNSASTLSAAIEALYPERKVKIYGRSGKAQKDQAGAMVLNAAY
jgi:uncharacterized protein (DUF1684 family)